MHSSIRFDWPAKGSTISIHFPQVDGNVSTAQIDLAARVGRYKSNGTVADVDPVYASALADLYEAGDREAVEAFLKKNSDPSVPPEPNQHRAKRRLTAAQDGPPAEGVATRLYDAGYRDLVSVIPPDVPLSPNSRIDPSQRGKVPGRKGSTGWYGYKWDVDVGRDMAEAIDRSSANLGLRGRRLPALDLDIENADLSKFVTQLAQVELGKAPVRLSREPRRLLMYRTDEPFKKRAAVISYRGQSHTVELLGDGQQYLVRGDHPSGARYRWKKFYNDPHELTSITEEDVDRFFETLAERLSMKGIEVEVLQPGRKAGGPDPVPDTIEAGARNATLASIAGTFRARNLSQDVCLVALKDENERRCVPPLPEEEIQRIVDSIYTNYPAGPSEHEIPADEEFEADPAAAATRAGKAQLIHADELDAMPDREVRWVVDDLIPAHGLSLLVAKPKVGKSTFARALAVAVAAGRPFLDRDVAQGPVVYVLFKGEGLADEIKLEWRRLARPEGSPLYLLDATNVEGRQALRELAQSVRHVQPRLVIVDTLQHIARVKDMNSYSEVHEKLDPIHRVARGAPILLLHHSPKNEREDVADAALGSTALYGASEVMIRLRRDRTDTSVRYLDSQGRYGELQPHVLEIDPQTHEPRLVGKKVNLTHERIEHDVLALIESQGAIAQKTVLQLVTGKSDYIKAALRRFVERELIRIVPGTGKRGHPLMYEATSSDEFTPEPSTAPELPEVPPSQAPYFQETGTSPPVEREDDTSDDVGAEVSNG
jgi:hypothetical protein